MLVAFESLKHRFERVFETRESFDGAGHGSAIDADERGHRCGGEDVRNQMRPDQSDRRQRDERLALDAGAPDDRVVVDHYPVGDVSLQ